MRRSSLLVVVPAMLSVAQAACAQNTLPSSGLRVDVRVEMLGRMADTFALAYRVLVRSTSTDSLSSFTVDAPGVVSLTPPTGGPREWRVASRFRRRPVADWSKTSRLVIPGDSTPPLRMRARGLLDVVQYWVQGDIALDSLITETPGDVTQALDTIVTLKGPTGFTVGVGPMPSDLSGAALAGRLRHLIERACSLGWIDREGTCNSLLAKARAQAGPANALLHELDAQRGKHVKELAYLLLVENVRFLITRL